MSEEKKSFLTAKNGAATGGLGALLTTVVPVILPEATDPWRPVLYAFAPILSAFITYLANYVISRHGLETPAEASLRNRYERDLKNIDRQLDAPTDRLTPEFRAELLKDREATVRQLVNIGKTVQVIEIDNKKSSEQ